MQKRKVRCDGVVLADIFECDGGAGVEVGEGAGGECVGGGGKGGRIGLGVLKLGGKGVVWWTGRGSGRRMLRRRRVGGLWGMGRGMGRRRQRRYREGGEE